MRKTTGWLAGLLALVLTGLAAPLAAQTAAGGAPLTIVVSYPPGGLSDYFARLVGAKLAESLGTTVLVENKPGANGSIGTAFVSRAKPDGQTITFLPASTVTTNQWLMKDMGFDPLKDLSPITLALVVPNVLVVTPAFPAKDFAELIALAKAKPGTVNFASVGVGSSPHLQGEMLKRMANIDIVHVAYKGAGPALQDLVGGQVQMMFDNLPSVLPMIQAGKLRALAVTSAKPAPLLPDVPPISRFLPGFEATPWFAFVGPANLPKEIVAKLNEHIVRAVKSDDIVKALQARGGEIVTGTPEELGALMKKDSEQMRQLIREADISLQ